MRKIRIFSIEKELLNMKIAFSNAQKPAILNCLQNVGYSKDRLNGYLGKIAEVEKLMQEQKKKQGEKCAKTHELRQNWNEIDKIYKRDLAFARIFFKDNIQAQTTLELSGKRKATFDGWHEQVRHFYAQIQSNSMFLDKMQPAGVTEQKINCIINRLKTISLLKIEQKKQMGEIRKITEKRNEILNELSPHYSELIKFAKMFVTDKQLLESIGVVVKRN